MTQVVYCIRDRNTGLHKIGISNDPIRRAKQLDIEHGARCEIVATMTAARPANVERFLHQALEGHRVMGEWFDLPPDRLAFILEQFVTGAPEVPQPVLGVRTRWRLKEYLDTQGITVYRLAKDIKEHGDKLSRTSIYNITTGRSNMGFEFNTMDILIRSLRRLTGKLVSLGDLLVTERDLELVVRPKQT